jgi:hypothetical protein
MTENEETEALAALVKGARGIYGGGERFHLRIDVVVAFVRGLLAASPNATPAELIEAGNKVGIPRSVLVQAARGERPAPPPQPVTAYSRRTRLSENLW